MYLPQRHWPAITASLCLLVAFLLITPMIVRAAEPIEGELTCGDEVIPVLIRGNGNAFRVTTDDETSNFVVKYAERDDGVVVVNSQGQQDKNLVECTLTSPDLEHSYFVRGFFTPRR